MNNNENDNHHQEAEPPHGRQIAPIQLQLSEDELSQGTESETSLEFKEISTTSTRSPEAVQVLPREVRLPGPNEEPDNLAFGLSSHHSSNPAGHSRSSLNSSRNTSYHFHHDSWNESQELRLLAKELDLEEKSKETGTTAKQHTSHGLRVEAVPNRHARRFASRGSHTGRGLQNGRLSRSATGSNNYHSSKSDEWSKEMILEDNSNISMAVTTPIAVSSEGEHYNNRNSCNHSYHSRTGDGLDDATMNVIEMLLEEEEDENTEEFHDQPHSCHGNNDIANNANTNSRNVNGSHPLHNSASTMASRMHNSASTMQKERALQDLEDQAVKAVLTNPTNTTATATSKTQAVTQVHNMRYHTNLEEQHLDHTMTTDSEPSTGIATKSTLSLSEIWKTPKMRNTLLCLICFVLILVIGVVVATLVVLGGDDGGSGTTVDALGGDTDVVTAGDSITPVAYYSPTTVAPTSATTDPGTTTITTTGTSAQPSDRPTVSPTALPSPTIPTIVTKPTTSSPLATFSPVPAKSGVNVRASYQARFQHLKDPNCIAPETPQVRLYCRGDIELVSTSDPRITCTNMTPGGWNGLECTVTCANDTECTQIYMVESGLIGNGNFGEVEFTCEGTEVNDVDAYLHYVAGPNGSCDATSSQNGRNFHVAQLGVACPETTTTTTTTAGVTYNFDDYFFEGDLNNFVGQFDGRYTVYDGTNCGSSSCTVRYDEVYIQAESHNFHHCMQPVGTSFAIPSPQTLEELRAPYGQTGYNYMVQFEANWQEVVDANFCSVVDGAAPTVQIMCLDDAQIVLVETLETSVVCDTISTSVLECSDVNSGNAYTGVIYTCTSSTLPETYVQYLPQDASCSQHTSSKTLRHNLQMGIHCQDPSGPLVTRFDYFFECGRDDNYSTGTTGTDYTCISTIDSPVGSTADDIFTIPITEMYTNYQWSRAAPTLGGCIGQTALP